MCRFLSLLLVLAACSSGGDPPAGPVGASQMVGPGGGQVVSADGKLTLTIPAGALPADTEITVRELTRSELGSKWKDADVAAAYELGPDGLVFQQPVTVTLLLDQSPVGPGGILQADVVILVTESGGTIEAAGAQELTADADAGTTTLKGEIAHFSRIIDVKAGVTLDVKYIPDSMGPADVLRPDLHILVASDSSTLGGMSVSMSGSGALGGVVVEKKIQIAAGEDVHLTDGEFSCVSPGAGRFWASATFFQSRFVVPYGIPTTVDFKCTVAVTKEIIHNLPRTFPLNLSALEGVLPSPVLFSSIQQTGPSPLVTIAGQDAWAMVDAVTGDELANVATPAGATYGAVPIDDGGAPAVFAFGAWGASVWPWESGAFGTPVSMSTNNITDAMPGANGGLIFVDNTAGKIRFLELGSGAYQVSSTVMDLANAVSAVELPDGSILALADGSPGKLYAAANRQSPLQPVSDVGSSPRRVRALGDVAAISSYGTGIGFGDITVATRQSGTWGIDFALVGPSSIGIDMATFEGGNIGILGTSYKSNQCRVIEVEPDGAYVADAFLDLPAGSEGPGHAIWLPETNELAVTCHDSSTLVVLPLVDWTLSQP